MQQETLTIAARVDPERLGELKALLERVRTQHASGCTSQAQGALLPLADVGTIHFARVVLVEDAAGVPAPDPILLFATDFDGEREPHLRELATRLGPGLVELFRCCCDFVDRSTPASLVAWLRRHAIEPLCTYRGHPGRSVEQIRREAALQDALADAARACSARAFSEVHAACRARVTSDAAHGWATTAPEPTKLGRLEKNRLRARWFVANAPRVARVVARAAFTLRGLEREDERRFLDAERPQGAALQKQVERDRDHTRALVALEDWTPQNQLTSVAELKPGALRRDLLELVLSLADLRARTRFDDGDLAGIRSIHFARWFLLESRPPQRPRTRLVFFSNFDGTWESYLGDFVDQATSRLTAIWTNTVGFPPTRWLFLGGAAYERWFKRFVRRSQVPTQVWYSAYPALSVSEVNRNSVLRKGLAGCDGLEDREQWLRSL